jgi:hypothetical protein
MYIYLYIYINICFLQSSSEVRKKRGERGSIPGIGARVQHLLQAFQDEGNCRYNFLAYLWHFKMRETAGTTS